MTDMPNDATTIARLRYELGLVQDALANARADIERMQDLHKGAIMTNETMAYAARFPGKPGFGAVCVDRPEFAKDTAKDIAGWIRKGATIERVSVESARAGMSEYLAARIGKGKS